MRRALIVSVKLLTWLFVTGRHHQTFRRLASRAFRLAR